jgi:hypothetical protein
VPVLRRFNEEVGRNRPSRNNGTVSGVTSSFCRSQVGSRPTYSCVRYQVGREPGIGPAELTCPNTDTDHSDQSVPVLFAPLLLEGRITRDGGQHGHGVPADQVGVRKGIAQRTPVGLSPEDRL